MKFNGQKTIYKNDLKITNDTNTGTIKEELVNGDTIVYNYCILEADHEKAVIKTSDDITTTIDMTIEEEINPIRYQRIIDFIVLPGESACN